MGKKREPSEDEIHLYATWLQDWGYDHDAVEAACSETTRGEPSFAYLNAILKGMMERRGKAMQSGAEMAAAKAAEQARIEPLKALIQRMGTGSVNDVMLETYDEMRELYSDDIILLAGEKCAKMDQASMENVLLLLESWKKRGLKDEQAIRAYIQRLDEENHFIHQLYQLWGMRGAGGTERNRNMLRKWREQFTDEMILYCGEFAAGKKEPMRYLHGILTNNAAAGILTPEQMTQAQAAYQARQGQSTTAEARPQRVKTVTEQAYHQREYKETTGMPDWMMEMWKEQNGHA